MNRTEAVDELIAAYGILPRHAHRVVNIAYQHGLKCAPTEEGSVTVRYRGESYAIAGGPPSADEMGVKGSAPSRKEYTSSTETLNTRNYRTERDMARRAAATVEPEKDYTVYADKPATPLMEDFADWIVDEVGIEHASKAAEAAFRNGVRLGGTLRMEFQKSDFCKERREERRAERENEVAEAKAAKKAAPKAAPKARGRAAAAATEADEDEPTAPAKPTRRGRATATATAKPARTARRGRAAKPADEEEEALY